MDFQQKLRDLARNLYWTWQPEMVDMFRDLEPALWREVNHNPIEFLSQISKDKLERKANDLALNARINQAFHHLKAYINEEYTWGSLHAAPLQAQPVAYFSAEFGLHESLPLYSGGLGVLSGDHLKSASDLGIPIVGVGLFYAQGYFNQKMTEEGWQTERYFTCDVNKLPIEKMLQKDGSPTEVRVKTSASTINAHIWSAKVGRNRLILLDSDVEENSEQDRKLTSSLYGGDSRTRIRQEILLGVGGLKALHNMNIHPGVMHLNEGHSAFATLEYARWLMEKESRPFEEVREKAANKVVFTTHTPLESGHDRFEPNLAIETLDPMRKSLGLSQDQMLGMGRVYPEDQNEHFCMTVLAFKLSKCANAVSSLHARTTEKMWGSLLPRLPWHKKPMNHITNGTHISSWIAVPMAQLFNRTLGPNWQNGLWNPDIWKGLQDIDNIEFWECLQVLKTQLIRFTHRSVCSQCSNGDQNILLNHDRIRLDPNTLTIGFSRRFSGYKRAFLILSDLDRLDRIINHPEHPVQIIFSGKAHPDNNSGKELLQQVVKTSKDPRFVGKLIFIEDYDINVSRHLIQGVDLWLNTPRRPLEACGTSGQKVVLNGGLNLSTLDGWWPEAYDGKNGFAIGGYTEHSDPGSQDRSDTDSLYETLENVVIPMFYDRDTDDIPHRWVALQKHAIRTLAWRFNAARMVKDYTRNAYLPAAGGATSSYHDGAEY